MAQGVEELQGGSNYMASSNLQSYYCNTTLTSDFFFCLKKTNMKLKGAVGWLAIKVLFNIRSVFACVNVPQRQGIYEAPQKETG
jgi:hypothetical protein